MLLMVLEDEVQQTQDGNRVWDEGVEPAPGNVVVSTFLMFWRQEEQKDLYPRGFFFLDTCFSCTTSSCFSTSCGLALS